MEWKDIKIVIAGREIGSIVSLSYGSASALEKSVKSLRISGVFNGNINLTQKEVSVLKWQWFKATYGFKHLPSEN